MNIALAGTKAPSGVPTCGRAGIGNRLSAGHADTQCTQRDQVGNGGAEALCGSCHFCAQREPSAFLRKLSALDRGGFVVRGDDSEAQARDPEYLA